jgi:hypothetical protein
MGCVFINELSGTARSRCIIATGAPLGRALGSRAPPPRSSRDVESRSYCTWPTDLAEDQPRTSVPQLPLRRNVSPPGRGPLHVVMGTICAMGISELPSAKAAAPRHVAHTPALDALCDMKRRGGQNQVGNRPADITAALVSAAAGHKATPCAVTHCAGPLGLTKVTP